MATALTPEQIELRDSLRTFLSEQAPLSYARKRFETESASDAVLWGKLSDLGVLPFFATPAADGGGSFRELGLLAAEAGYALLGENLIDAAFALLVLTRVASDADRKAIAKHFGAAVMDELAAGNLRLGVAPFNSELSEKVRVSGGSVSLTARYVSAAPALSFLITVNEADSSLLLCDLRPEAQGTKEISAEECLDRTERRYRVTLKKTPALKLAAPDARNAALAYRAIKSAELSGAARHALDLTVEYVKTRKQFDAPIGGFQAVQHAAADMLLRVEALQAAADFACWTAEGSPDQLELAALAAVAYGSEEAPKVAEKAIQLHGGIGFTWEHDLHLLLRRIRTLVALHGSSASDATALIAAAQNS